MKKLKSKTNAGGTVKLAPDVHRQVKIAAVTLGITMQDVLRAAGLAVSRAVYAGQWSAAFRHDNRSAARV